MSADYVYDMDMNDIETVTVLKDASASALYGSKASAGVVVITTKAMKGGRLRLNYSGTYRLNMPDLSDYHLLNSAQNSNTSAWPGSTRPKTTSRTSICSTKNTNASLASCAAE